MDIEQLVKQVESNFRKTFVEQLKEFHLFELIKYCHPIFSTNFKKKEYQYDVNLQFKIELKSNQSFEHFDNGEKRLVEKNQSTGEEKIIISNSYSGIAIYRSTTAFFPLNEPINTIKEIDKNYLAKLDLNSLEMNRNWEVMFDYGNNN